MILGMTSVPMFPCLLYVIMFLLRQTLSEGWVISLSAVVSWVICVLGVSIPIYFVVKCARRNVIENQIGEESLLFSRQ